MRKNKTISVLMPARNVRKYVREAIDSILKQSYTDFEFIIMDDASDDGTDKVICSYTDDRIIFLRNEQCKGNYASRNQLARLAKGKYLAMMDADDIAMPDRLEKQWLYIEAHPEVLAIGSDRISIPMITHDKVPHEYKDIVLALLNDNAFVHSSLLIRTEAFRELEGYDTQYRYAADYDLACRLALVGKIENRPHALVKYRWHPEQISQKHQSEQTRFAAAIRVKYQMNFINRFRKAEQALVNRADVAHPRTGQLIAWYTYSQHTENTEYLQKADILLNEFIADLSGKTPFRLEGELLGMACGFVYLLRNGFVEGEEDEVLAEIDEQLFRNLAFLMKEKKMDWYGWLYYFRLRISYNRQPEQQLQGLIFRQNFISMLDCLAEEIQNGWIPDDEVLLELRWFHKEHLCPVKTAMALSLPALPTRDIFIPVNNSRVTFVIPVRIDSAERERNLDLVLEELAKIENAEICILEGDMQMRYKMKKLYPNIQHAFLEDTDPVFHRTKYLNRLLKEAKSDIVGVWDTDVMIAPEQIRDAIQAIKEKQAVISFPYSGDFYMLPESISTSLAENCLYKEVLDGANSKKFLCIHRSAGGAFLVNRKSYLAAGGENEHFYGWGPEDVERVKRMEILKLPIYRAKGPLFHLYHPRKENSRYKNIQQEIRNRKEFLRICSMTPESIYSELSGLTAPEYLK